MDLVLWDKFDKPRKLKLGTMASMEFEKASGITFNQIARDESLVGMNVAVCLVWAAMKWEDRGITLQRVTMLVDEYFDRGGTLLEIISLAWDILKSARMFVVAQETQKGTAEGNAEGEA